MAFGCLGYPKEKEQCSAFQCLLLIFGLLFFASFAHSELSPQTESCLSCHTESTSYVVEEWKHSKHYQQGVGCFECHRSSLDTNPAAFKHQGEVISLLVTPNQCKPCHTKEVEEYTGSIHATSGIIAQLGSALGGGAYWNIAASVAGWVPWDFSKGREKKSKDAVSTGDQPIKYKGNVVKDPFWKRLKETPASRWGNWPQGTSKNDKPLKDVLQIFADWGCLWCHGSTVKILKKTPEKVEFYPETYPSGGAGRVNPDGSLGNCSACHPHHSFSLAVARDPSSCGRCHESEDHPNLEAYYRSMHGAMYLAKKHTANYDQPLMKAGKDYLSPSCANCHMGAVYRGKEMLYPPSHDPACIAQWKFGAWQVTLLREKGMAHPVVKEAWIRVNPRLGVEFVQAGTAGASRVPVSFPSSGMQNRERALAVCNQCHNKQWVGNFFLSADSTVFLLQHIRDMAFDAGNELKKVGVFTPLDNKKILDIGAMGVRPTQIMMYHTSPGLIWWDGIYKLLGEYAEWIESSVAPRLGTEKASVFLGWLDEYEGALQRMKGKTKLSR